MHRHHSLGTTDLVALLAAHRAAMTAHTVPGDQAEITEEGGMHLDNAETRRPGRLEAEG
jgi:hypothetical protein